MKKTKQVALGLVMLCLSVSCKKENNTVSETGKLSLQTTISAKSMDTKSSSSANDVAVTAEEFWVYIYKDDALLDGYPILYSSLAAEIELAEGSYRVVAESMLESDVVLPTRNADEGLYYSGETDVIIVAEETTNAEIVATQAVGSVVVVFTEKFKQAFTDYSAVVSGILFDDTNADPAYFEAGNILEIVLTYTDNGEEKVSTFQTSKAVEAGDDWTLTFDASGDLILNGSGAITISISTETNPQSETWDIEIGGDPAVVAEIPDGDGSVESPYSVAQARLAQDGTVVWVQGYIVGNVKGTANVTADWTLAGDTNVAIAATAGETDVTKMLFVRLDSSGTAREKLGLYSTSGASLGLQVKVYGTLEAYYGNAGLTGVNLASEFVIIQ